jgi:N4-bis(aminopropyl)spermidine synthase
MRMAATSILDLVAQRTRLREGPAGVSALLRAVYRAGSLRLQEAARQTRLPLPVATAVRRELEKLGLLERKQGLSLTQEGLDFVERELGLQTNLDTVCATCEGRGIIIPELIQSGVDRLSGIVGQAPSVDVTLDQAPCTPATALRRALLMLQIGALEGQRVLLLGDDDSVSIAIGMLGHLLHRGDLTRDLTVIDADERRLTFLQEAAEREQFALRVVHHDLRRPLPAALKHSFDAIQTDPPYTLEGARLFLARGGEALRTTAGGIGLLSFAHWPASQMLELQSVFIELGFGIRSLRPNFNEYMGATVLGNRGQLIELERVRAIAADLPDWTGPLFTSEVNPRTRTYVCAGCGAATVLGQDHAPSTIEELKTRGCSVCGASVFRRHSA